MRHTSRKTIVNAKQCTLLNQHIKPTHCRRYRGVNATPRIGTIKQHVLAVALTIVCALCFSSISAAATNGPQQTRTYHLDLPEQTVATALNSLSEQTDIQVLFPYDIAAQLRSEPLLGRFSIELALERLLRDTGLHGGLTSSGVITISQTGSESTTNQNGKGKRMNIKNSTKRKTLLAGLVGLFAAGGTAQVAAQGGEAATSQSAIDEIIVTAQKREQSLAEVPISIAVLHGQNIDRNGARGVSDILNAVGSVNLIEAQPGETSISIRGASSTIFSPTTVGYYQDELPFSFIWFNLVPDTGAFDLDRVEVLRGPQGTLFGAGSLNGVVRVLTKDANLDQFELKTRTRFSSTEGGDASYSGDVAINLPMIPGKLAIRGVASYSDMGGFIDSSIGENINDSELDSYRFKVNAQPTDELRIEFGAVASRIDNGAPSRADRDLFSPFTTEQPDSRDYDILSLEVEYDFSSFSLLSATSSMDYDTDTSFDLFLAPSFPLTVIQDKNVEIFSQEIRAVSTLDGDWEWSAGVFYRTIDQLQSQFAPAFFPTPATVTDESESYAVFGELTRSFMDEKLDVTLGLRYFEDKASAETKSVFAGPLPENEDADFEDPTGRIVISYFPEDGTTVYGSISRGFRSGYNQFRTALSPDAEPLEPDSLITYEFGTKGSFSGGRMMYEAAVYYSSWKDAMLFVVNDNGLGVNVNSDSEINGFGIDASLSAEPFEGLKLQGSIGWNDLTYDEDVFQQGLVLFSKGTRISSSPEYTAGISADYVFPLIGDELQGRVSFAANYSSEQITQSLVGTLNVIDESDDIFNAKINLLVESGDQWSAGFFVENISNEDGQVSAPVTSFPSVRLRPRTAGVQLTLNF